MGRMNELHMEMCENVEKIMCDRLCMVPCEATYELAADIIEAVSEDFHKTLKEEDDE